LKQAETNNSHEPTVSVCIANYNGLGILDECINSVRNQDCGFSVEIIIHDDASTDGSVQHIPATYPEIILIKSTENVGFCVANNRMVLAAKGKYLLLLNNDATLFPDALRMLYQEAEKIICPTIFSLPQYDFDSGELVDHGCLLDPFFNPVPNMNLMRRNVAMVIGACMWVPKSLWVALGCFPEWFGSIAEDMYMCCLARLEGYQVQVIGSSGYRHRSGMSFGGGKITKKGYLASTIRRRVLSERNKSFVMILTCPSPIFQILFCLHLIALILEGVLISLAKCDLKLWNDIYLACLVAIWRRRGELKEERKIIQGNRRCTVLEFFSMFGWFPHKLRMLWRYGLPIIR